MPETNSSPFVKWALAVIATITTLAIVGGFRIAMSQSSQEARLAEVEETQKENRAAVQAVPVIQKDIDYIQGDIEELKDDVSEIKDGIEEIKAAVKR